jgi:hypothetical protein
MQVQQLPEGQDLFFTHRKTKTGDCSSFPPSKSTTVTQGEEILSGVAMPLSRQMPRRTQAERLNRFYDPNMGQTSTVRKDFDDLCRVNHCAPESTCKTRAWLRGTLRAYVSHVTKEHRSAAAYIAQPFLCKQTRPCIAQLSLDRESLTTGPIKAHLCLTVVASARSKDSSLPQ